MSNTYSKNLALNGVRLIGSERLRAVLELIAFLAIALISKRLLDPLFWRYSGPVSLVGTLFILAVYMRWRGRNWSDMGLPSIPGSKHSLMTKRGLIARIAVCFVGFSMGVGSLLISAELFQIEFLQSVPTGVDDRWGSIEGNLSQYLLWLGIVWTAAAFGEEIFFRGFLITQLQIVLGSKWWSTILAVVLAAVIFGYGHYYYQGLRGFVFTGTIGLVFGTLFILFKRNLWPIIIFHGCVDTLTFTAIYLGLE